MRRHLEPEEFIDVLEGAPVEAETRQHLASCVECSRELRDLDQTLGILRNTRSGSRGRRRYALWAAAAAALLIGVAFLYRGSPVHAPNDADAALLAPIEEDRDFQVLEALSRELTDEDVFSLPLEEFPDASDLTSSELKNLLDQLASEMSSTS